MPFIWKALGIITEHSHALSRPNLCFAGCWKFGPVCWSRCLTWPLTQLLSAKIWADPWVVLHSKNAFRSVHAPNSLLHYYTVHALDLSQKAQGRGSKYCIVMPERNKYGLRVSIEYMKNGPKSKSVCTKEESWGMDTSILLLYEQNKSCSNLELTVSAFLVECGAGLRYSYRHRIICDWFVCMLEEQVTPGKEIWWNPLSLGIAGAFQSTHLVHTLSLSWNLSSNLVCH